ncbi:MAG: DNA polymerase III subunit gamma/tau [Lachnospiraceae bacterium]|nr:DNA polymerase III subunit gamma/tau [Lachnospiraceae bacterium]
MAYTAFYRKHRPQNFDEVRGQEAVVTTLRNQIKSGRVGHAYLFCGTRGTGKTSIAKIFARAVNCEHPVDGSCCNECPTCKGILNGTSMNVVEIDAASNNGVDNIREIREEVKYPPTEGKYRVYIIDEVHMLSAGAYNALLKTLEEPPSYVIFILATTEVHKIPVTVLSRCQRYDFKRIPTEAIYDQLVSITQKEGVEAEENALRYIARAGDGAMRDALSILEQCVSFHFGERLTYEQVLEIIGASDIDVFVDLMTSIRDCETRQALQKIDDICYSGRDPGQFVSDFVWFMRNLLMLQTGVVSDEELGILPERRRGLEQLAQSMTMDQLMNYIRVFSETGNRLRSATQKRAVLEVDVLRLMYPQMLGFENSGGFSMRIAKLEQIVAELAKNGVAPIDAQFTAQSVKNAAEGATEASAMPRYDTTTADSSVSQSRAGSPAAAEADANDLGDLSTATENDLPLLLENWEEIKRNASPLIRRTLEYAKPEYRGGFKLVFSEKGSREILTDVRLEELQKSIARMLGRKFILGCVLEGRPDAGADSGDGTTRIKNIDFPIHRV